MAFSLNRRAAMLGALASSTAVAVPALAEQPVEYRITKEQAEAIAAWQVADIIKSDADAAYHEWTRSLPKGVSTVDAPDQTIRSAWFDAEYAESAACQHMLALLSASDPREGM